MLIYDFDRPGEGLALEAMGAEGDSGSAAFIDVNGTLIIAGVNSNEKEAIYGTKHQYTRVGDLNAPWIKANLASPNVRVSVENCFWIDLGSD